MKRALLAAAIALVGCDTVPPDPYGPGYPAPDPGYSTGYPAQQGPPIQARCPIARSSDWRAFINAMPGPNARPKLIVTGTVVAPSGGYQFRFEPYLQFRESNPVQAFATLQAVPPQGPATQALVTHDLRWEWPVNQQIGSVEIRCGSDTLARIAPVERAY